MDAFTGALHTDSIGSWNIFCSVMENNYYDSNLNKNDQESDGRGLPPASTNPETADLDVVVPTRRRHGLHRSLCFSTDSSSVIRDTMSDHSSAATITVVHCWSAPRSRSTALLYSFEARGDDTIALDEPLYREWLIQKGHSVERPYLASMMDGTSPDGANVDKWQREQLSMQQRILDGIEALSGRASGIIFCKHMAKHSGLYDLEQDMFLEAPRNVEIIQRHVLLIRDPVAVLSSWSNSSHVHGNSPSTDEVGIIPLLAIYSTLTSHSTLPVVLLDSDDLASDPSGTLGHLCAELGIEYTDAMLTWPAGPKACDGPWAKWWYDDVHKSTGWVRKSHMAPLSKYRTLDPTLVSALRASMPAYTFLHSQIFTRPTMVYEDARNADLLVWIGTPGRGRLLPRDMAGVSPFDSSVQGGDAAWEGLRVYRGKILSLDKHLRRLFKSAKALGFEKVHTKEEVVESIFRVLAANGMRDGAHMRLTLTRGEKCTSSMNPVFNIYGTTLIILPEWKPTEGATTYDNRNGISLITASQRRNRPDTVDSKIHHNNLINNILPKIQANLAGCADAIMLDVDGYVSETNATNLFLVDDGVLMTPHADHCLPGITRQTVITLAAELGIPCEVRRISLSEFHSADEVFTTGTMGELTPVTKIDGRVIGNGERGVITARLQETYQLLPERDGWATPLPDFETLN